MSEISLIVPASWIHHLQHSHGIPSATLEFC